MDDFPCDKFKKIQPIDRGRSGDKKFYVEGQNGERLLLRVSDIAAREQAAERVHAAGGAEKATSLDKGAPFAV